MNRLLNSQFTGRPVVPSLPKAKVARAAAGRVYARTPPERTKPNWKLEKKDRLVEGGGEVWCENPSPSIDSKKWHWRWTAARTLIGLSWMQRMEVC